MKVWLVLFLCVALFLISKKNVENFITSQVCPDKIPPAKRDQIVVQNAEHVIPRIKAVYVQHIPRIIIQTNEKEFIPLGMKKAIDSILDKNPEYEYKYFTDKSARQYLVDNFREDVVKAYDKLKPGAYKADLFRYCILYKSGGVYIDTGMVAKKSLKDLISPKDTFISPEDDNTGGIFNAFMACIPKHPIIEKALLITLKNVLNGDYCEHPLDITGPAVLGKAFSHVTNEKPFADSLYGNGIRLIRYRRTEYCTSAGKIWDKDTVIFNTKYPGYYIDRLWYNTNLHYSELWHRKDVYN